MKETKNNEQIWTRSYPYSFTTAAQYSPIKYEIPVIINLHDATSLYYWIMSKLRRSFLRKPWALLRELGTNAYETVEKKYKWGICAKRFEQIYNEAILISRKYK